MKYINIILFYLKQRKKLVFFLFTLGLLVFNFKTVTNKLYFYRMRGYDNQSSELMRLINSVIGIPYQQKPQYKNDSPDIFRLSKEEWFKLPYYKKGHKPLGVRDEPRLVEPMPSKEEVWHAESLSLEPIFYGARPNKGIFHELCGYFLTCKSLNIGVPEYVYEKPELLRSIIKIAERPCDYIRTIDEVKPGDEIVFATSVYGGFYAHKYDREAIESSIKLAKQRFNCDQKSSFNLPNRLYFTFPTLFYSSIYSRKYVLIVINRDGMVTSEDKPSIDIIIERKDID
jgi:hypothetical protein